MDAPSFAEKVKASSPPSNELSPQQMKFRNKPAVLLPKSYVEARREQFKLAIIGSFSKGRPSMKEIRDFFYGRGIHEDTTFGLMKGNRHIIIRCATLEDYMFILKRRFWEINSKYMRALKWVPYFNPAKEPTFAAVWVSIHDLPVEYIDDPKVIMMIGSWIGFSLKMDKSTVNFNRPSVARLLVEVDIAAVLVDSVVVGPEDDPVDVYIEYEDLPPFCKHCRMLGHWDHSCHRQHPTHCGRKGIQCEESSEYLGGEIQRHRNSGCSS